MRSKIKKRLKRISDSTSDQDRFLDYQRYDRASKLELKKIELSGDLFVDKPMIPQQFREPFDRYYETISEFIPVDSKTLELGAGSGAHTAPLLKNSKKVYANDISGASLKLLQIRLGIEELKKVTLVESRMDSIPIPKESVDVVVSCGSWSYADEKMLIMEIKRVLRPGGILIVLDSLNHNPLYRFNRYLRFKKGERTLSTIMRIPTTRTFEALSQSFSIVNIKYFGSFYWLFPLLRKILGVNRGLQFESQLTRFAPKKMAFKFLLVAKKM
jgi:ubiquinone/menaquinone biosynthesis C-methylase UbiE